MAAPASGRSTRSKAGKPAAAPAARQKAPAPVLSGSEATREPRPKRSLSFAAPPPPSEPRTSTKLVQERATAAIICYYHPLVDKTERSQKAQWATFFNVEKPRFAYWEGKLAESLAALL